MKIVYLLSILFYSSVAFSQKTIKINSPDNNIQTAIIIKDQGIVFYNIHYKKSLVIKDSQLGMSLVEPKISLTKFKIISVDSSSFNEDWKPVWGEVSIIKNQYKELILRLKESSGSNIFLNVIFRVFNDGVGFRYEFPRQDTLIHFIVSEELTEFSLNGDHKTFWIPGNYDSNEFAYNTTKLSEIDAGRVSSEKAILIKAFISKNAVQTPLMMKTGNGLYINIHEAALVNYPAMNLVIDKDNLTFQTHLVPDAFGNKAYLQTPAKTPWRTILICDKAADILSSKLILNLNEPSVIQNASFIKPQKFIGMWWEMQIGNATWDFASGRHGATTANVKRYIDFAALHKMDGVLVEGWNVGWEDWSGKWKENVFDFITPYPDYNIDELVKYAKIKNVKIIMHHETSGSVTNYERYMDTAYRFMLDHNMNTVKTGYVGRIIPRGEHHDGQWMVNHYVRVAAKTARYKIMLDAHEPVRPTGLHRTYPNWLTSEAARGNEFNAFSNGNMPEHETILPFTRLVGGPMDYTPGIFRIKLNQFEHTKKNVVHTTLTKQLALYVTMYSPLQMAADLPQNYEAHPDAFKFIEDVAVDWDDTKILEAEPGAYITIARKAKGKSSWFIGGITNENSRLSHIELNFLETGKKYMSIIYKDAANAHWQINPEAYLIEKSMVDKKSIIDIKIAPGGGYAMSIEQLN